MSNDQKILIGVAVGALAIFLYGRAKTQARPPGGINRAALTSRYHNSYPAPRTVALRTGVVNARASGLEHYTFAAAQRMSIIPGPALLRQPIPAPRLV